MTSNDIAPEPAPPEDTPDTPATAVGDTSTSGPSAGPAVVRSWPVLLLAAPAFVAIWSGWVGLGTLTGFGKIHPLPGTPLAGWTLDTAITLPIGVETYAAFALRVWLTAGPGLSSRAVRFARASAIASLALGAAGQVAYHLMTAAHVTAAPWWIVTVVACLPVAVLGMGAALAHLIRDTPTTTPTAGPTSDTAPQSTAFVGPNEPVDVEADVDPDGVPDGAAGPEPDTKPDAGPDVVPDVEMPARRTPVRTPGPRRSGGGGTSTTAAAVARLRRRHPDMTTTAIAKRLGVTDRTVRRHLADLAAQAGMTGVHDIDQTEQQTASAGPARVMEVVR